MYDEAAHRIARGGRGARFRGAGRLVVAGVVAMAVTAGGCARPASTTATLQLATPMERVEVVPAPMQPDAGPRRQVAAPSQLALVRPTMPSRGIGRGTYKIGKPYQIKGQWYYPKEQPSYDEVGVASWYGADFHGGKTANGEIFDMHSLTAAHKTLPLPSYAEVTNLANGRTVLVRINNRGPFVGNRLIDLSRGTARILGFEGKGLSRVRVRYIGRAPLDGDTSRERAYLMAQRWYREMVASGGLRAAPPRRTAAN